MESNQKQAIAILLGIVAFIIFIVGAGVLVSKACANGSCSAPEQSYSAPAPEAKPATKTRCDWTGVMSSSIIAEEAANGYAFAGRVNTFLCGDSGLSFYLREQ